ncbi:bis(5'-nucleosyl)-tetraphosphatase (symmetrical) YqeK [Rubrobacter indicoceani]|uniref:bis(5'-nucleosyl)-tetraphosphatase (symmetrical) YqeK n=1 Tax=Rubrobacter indicoceani TaxID=2051957 RepID=UPI000E5B8BF4|nr:bis(5'-nucleosyl)-tetraphosphatase (symmetrical) YqeK [Rubrobacter indicoceani]
MTSLPKEMLLRAADLARRNLSDARYGHTLRVAECAEHLARLHGVDGKRARLAALIHDAARELPKDEYLELAREWDIPTEEPERENPKLLHGAVAAEMARRELGVTDRDVLKAVREHTVGAAEMTGLSLVLFLADKIESARDYPSVERIRALSGENLRGAVAETLRRSITYNEELGKPTHPESRAALRWLEERQGR